MKLYLVQHGEAAASNVDPERPLTERGNDDLRRMAKALHAAGVRNARVLHSGKLRARQSAQWLAAGIAPEVTVEAGEALQPNDDPAVVTALCGSWDDDTLLVGHLPFMARLAALLVTGNPDCRLVSFVPGSVLCLARDDDGAWSIDWMLRPELLG